MSHLFWNGLLGLVAFLRIMAAIDIARGIPSIPALAGVTPLQDADCPPVSILFAARDEAQELPRALETFLALDKQAWDAASRRDWKVYEKLLRPGYYWGYFGSSRNGPAVKDVQRRRYFDVNIREVEVGKITEDVAFLKYVYNCKVEEAGQVQTYRDRQSMQIWTQINGDWLLTYTTNFILTGGE